MEIIKLRHIGHRYVEIKVGDGCGSEIDLGTFQRDMCRSIAQHLRDVADELEDD